MQSSEILNQKQGEIKLSHEVWRNKSLRQKELALYLSTRHHYPAVTHKLTNTVVEAVQLVYKFRRQCGIDIMHDTSPHDEVEVFVGTKEEMDFITALCFTEMITQARLFRFKVKERQEFFCYQTEFCHQNRAICFTLNIDQLCNI
jgi:hypothetical protein